MLLWFSLKIIINNAWKVCKYEVFSGLYFPAFQLNTGKYGAEKTPYLDTFCALSFGNSGRDLQHGYSRLIDLKNVMSSSCKKYQSEFKKQPPRVFLRKGVPRNFAKFIAKHLCQGLFLNKVAGLRPFFLKEHLWTTTSWTHITSKQINL